MYQVVNGQGTQPESPFGNIRISEAIYGSELYDATTEEN